MELEIKHLLYLQELYLLKNQVYLILIDNLQLQLSLHYYIHN